MFSPFKYLILRERGFGAVGSVMDILLTYGRCDVEVIDLAPGLKETKYSLEKFYSNRRLKSLFSYLTVCVRHADDVDRRSLDTWLRANAEGIVESLALVTYSRIVIPESYGDETEIAVFCLEATEQTPYVRVHLHRDLVRSVKDKLSGGSTSTRKGTPGDKTNSGSSGRAQGHFK